MASISYTSQNIPSGKLPSGYDLITLTLISDFPIRITTLPQSPSSGSKVKIINNHPDRTIVKYSILEKDEEGIILLNNKEILLTYNNGHWIPSGPHVNNYSPNQVGATIPELTTAFANYSLANGNFTNVINLPKQAKNNDQIFITSTATSAAKVNQKSLYYENNFSIKKGDVYLFRFMDGFKKWVPIRYPTRTLTLSKNQIPTPGARRSLITLSNTKWFKSLLLPEAASNRDRIVIRSTASKETNIKAKNIVNPAVMKVNKGDEYEFLYVAEKKGWVLVHSTDTKYDVKNLKNGNVPALKRPRTIVSVANGNWSEFITLPKAQPKGSRVIIQSESAWSTTVIAGPVTYAVTKGETVVFKVNKAGKWSKETVTIDLLLLYSDKAATLLSKGMMEQRLKEGLKLTNEALENSGANFRFRALDIRQVTTTPYWTTMSLALISLTHHADVQAWRKELRADIIYYEGTEKDDLDKCFRTWTLTLPQEMVVAGSILCNTTTMRQGLAQNMGVKRGGETSFFDQGYTAVETILGGDQIPFYSTPHRYMPITGIPLGIVNKYDAVRAMNEISAKIAAFA